MAEHIEIGKAYVTIVPSLEGSQSQITKELTGATNEAAEKAGDESGKTYGNKFANALKGTGAAIAGALTAVTGAVVASGKAFIDSANDVAEYGDTVDKMSQKMGISATAYQEWDFIMQHAGASIESLKGSMKTLATAAESNNEAFEILGITQEQIASMSQEELFGATISALQNVGDETERTYLASKLLGRGATELGALFNMSAEETEALRSQVHELGGVMSDDAVKDAAAYKDAMQNMSTSLTGLKNNMMSQFLPGITSVMDGLSKVFSGDDSGMDAINEGIGTLVTNLTELAPELMRVGGTIISSLLTAITTNLPILLEAAVPIVMELITGIINNLPAVITAAVSLLGSIVQGINDNIGEILLAAQQVILTLATAIAENAPTIIPTVVGLILTIATTLTSPEFLIPLLNAGLQIILGLINGILTALPMIIEQLPVIIENIVNVLLEGLPLILQAGIDIFNALIEALPVIMTALTTALPEVIQLIVDLVINGLPLLLEGAIQLLMALIDALPTIITALVQNIPTLVVTIIETLINNIPNLIKGAIQLLMGIITAIPTIIVELGKNMPEIITAIVNGLMDGLSQITSVGADLIRGLWEGISDMASWIGEKLKSFGDGILGGLKDFFGIASPSKLFEKQLGQNLALGIGKGFDDEIDTVTDDMVDKMDGLTSNMTASVDAYGNPSNGLAGAGEITNYNGGAVTINVYGAEGQSVDQLADVIADRFEHRTKRKGQVYA